MIRHEIVAEPFHVYVREPWREGGGGRCYGHGAVVARHVALDRCVISYEVRMQAGDTMTVTLDHLWSPANISRRMITPAPLRIPPVPARAVRL